MKRSKANASPSCFSADVLKLNPALGILPSEKLAKQAHGASRMPAVTSESVLGGQIAKKGKRRKEMNKIEAEFAMFMEDLLRKGNIQRYEYEGLTLRWPDGMRYTPDFVIYHVYRLPRISLIEIKGAFAWQKDIVKFRAAKAYWPMYQWEFWSKTSTGWEMTR